jgi:hypothetical protein
MKDVSVLYHSVLFSDVESSISCTIHHSFKKDRTPPLGHRQRLLKWVLS